MLDLHTLTPHRESSMPQIETSNDVLDALSARHNYCSDYRLAQMLGRTLLVRRFSCATFARSTERIWKRPDGTARSS